MPAQRRALIRKTRPEKRKRFGKMLKVTLLVIFFIGLYFSLARRFWDSDSKMVLTIADVDDGVRVVTLDPVNSQIDDYFIPGTTEVEVSSGLGVWKLKSVWDLGVQEKIGGGQLLTETLTKHARIPTFVYSKKDGYGLISGNIKEVIPAIFKSYDTNMSFGDRLRVAFFSFNVKNTKRVELDLSNTRYLTKKQLTDGEMGFEISNQPFESLTLVFSDYSISQNFPKVVINDNTGSSGYSEKLSSLIEVLGGKVFLVSKGAKGDLFCSVGSKSKDVARYLSRLLGCKIEKVTEDGKFDIEITIGEKFSRNY